MVLGVGIALIASAWPTTASAAKPSPSPTRGAWPASGIASAALSSYLGPNVGGPEPEAGTPESLQQAYDLGYLSATHGGSTTIALVEIGGDPTAEADLAYYRAWFGLPPCTAANGCLRIVNKSGGVGESADNGQNIRETSLDADAVSALCPLCHILIVDAEGAMSTGEETAVRLGARIISNSWSSQGGEALYETWNFPGIATIASSGDNGYFTESAEWAFPTPASMPNVTAAGGTDLLTASESGAASLRGYTETAWSGSGSTCDPYIQKPAWQTDRGCPGRSVADLSAEGGTAIYTYVEGHWSGGAGTSLASPLIAAFYALTEAPAENPSWAYQSAAALNDITAGPNGGCPASMSYICTAGPGYDGPTGVGSISGSAVRGAPGIARAGMANGTYLQRATYESGSASVAAALQGGIYTNGLPTAYWWQYGYTVFEHQTPAQSLPASCSISSVTAQLDDLEPNATYAYRLVAQNALGTSYGYTSKLRTNPSQLPAPESPLPTPAPTSCPTPAPFPDAPNPVRPRSAGSGGPKKAPHPLTISRLSFRHGLIRFHVECPPATAGPCIVKATAKGHHLSGRGHRFKAHETLRLKAGGAATMTLHVPRRLPRDSAIELKVLARTPPAPFKPVVYRLLRVHLEKKHHRRRRRHRRLRRDGGGALTVAPR